MNDKAYPVLPPSTTDASGPKIIGWDLSNGVETHVEGYWKDGVLHITEHYEIINHEGEE